MGGGKDRAYSTHTGNETLNRKTIASNATAIKEIMSRTTRTKKHHTKGGGSNNNDNSSWNRYNEYFQRRECSELST